MKFIGSLALLLTTYFATSAILYTVSANDVIGIWTTGSGDARVEIHKSAGKYNGKIVWLKEPVDPDTKQPKKDKNNPESSKRNRALLGLEILQGFEWDASDREWDNGTIYDPKSGKTYSCYMTLKDQNTLEVRGYVGVSWLGRTDTWTRYR